MLLRIPFIILLLLSLAGCSATYLKQSTNVSGVKKNYDNILVVARSKDKTTRIKAEQQMVADLQSRGVSAITSLAVIASDNMTTELDEEQKEKLRTRLLAEGYTGVLVTSLIDTRHYSDVISGGRSVEYVPVRYGRFSRYYGYYPVSYWEPDQVVTGTEYILESCLYDLTLTGQDNLQWVGRFKVKDPTNLVKTIERYSQELTDELMLQSLQP